VVDRRILPSGGPDPSILNGGFDSKMKSPIEREARTRTQKLEQSGIDVRKWTG